MECKIRWDGGCVSRDIWSSRWGEEMMSSLRPLRAKRELSLATSQPCSRDFFYTKLSNCIQYPANMTEAVGCMSYWCDKNHWKTSQKDFNYLPVTSGHNIFNWDGIVSAGQSICYVRGIWPYIYYTHQSKQPYSQARYLRMLANKWRSLQDCKNLKMWPKTLIMLDTSVLVREQVLIWNREIPVERPPCSLRYDVPCRVSLQN